MKKLIFETFHFLHIICGHRKQAFYSKPEIKWNWIGAFWAGKGLIWQIKGRLSMGSRRVKTNGKRMVRGSLKHSIHEGLCPKPYCGQKGKFLGYLRTSPGKSHACFFFFTWQLPLGSTVKHTNCNAELKCYRAKSTLKNWFEIYCF